MGISKELIIDGYNGFFVERLSPLLIAQKVGLILENKKLQNEMKEKSISFARQYDWKRIVDVIESVYSTLSESNGISNKHPPSPYVVEPVQIENTLCVNNAYRK
jgi:hypothetical protein